MDTPQSQRVKTQVTSDVAKKAAYKPDVRDSVIVGHAEKIQNTLRGSYWVDLDPEDEDVYGEICGVIPKDADARIVVDQLNDVVPLLLRKDTEGDNVIDEEWSQKVQ